MATVIDESVVPDIVLESEDGEKMDTGWHRLAMELLIACVVWLYRARNDFYVGGNMFIYYSEEQARNKDYRGPDFFYVNGVNREPIRKYWVVWQEGGKYPDVIIELMSPTTAQEDLTKKKDIYETIFRTHEYFCYDPEEQRLGGWRLIDQRYQTIEPNEKGWLWCKEFGLWLGTWTGKFHEHEAVWLRFYQPDGQLVPMEAEAMHQLAEAEHQKLEAERRRAEAAEKELAALKAIIAKQQTLNESGNGPNAS